MWESVNMSKRLRRRRRRRGRSDIFRSRQINREEMKDEGEGGRWEVQESDTSF